MNFAATAALSLAMSTDAFAAAVGKGAALHKPQWREALRTDLEQSVRRTTLQAGIFNDLLLDYKPGRVIADDLDLGFDDDARPGTAARLDDAQMRELVVPQLTAVVQARLAPLVDTPMIDYRFTCRGKFQTAQGKLHLTLLEYVNEDKRQALLENIHAYIGQKLTHGKHPTKPLETFFLARPVVGARAGLQANRAGRQRSHQLQQLGASHGRLDQHGLACFVDAMHGKNTFGQVNANKDDAHGLSPCGEWMKSLRFPSWHRAAERHRH